MKNKICVRCGMEYPDHKMSCKIPVEKWRLPTAEEYFEKRYEEIGINHVDEIDGEDVLIAIEFAKLHVEEALKAAMKKTYKKVNMRHYEDELYKDEILTNTIIKAYPLNNIK